MQAAVMQVEGPFYLKKKLFFIDTDESRPLTGSDQFQTPDRNKRNNTLENYPGVISILVIIFIKIVLFIHFIKDIVARQHNRSSLCRCRPGRASTSPY